MRPLCLTPGWGHMVQPSLEATQETLENVSPSGFVSKSSNNCSFLRKYFRVFGGRMEGDKERTQDFGSYSFAYAEPGENWEHVRTPRRLEVP